jgi:enoyl-CoA hydratase
MANRITYALDEGVARISLDDGKVNVMSVEMLDELDLALSRAERDGAMVLLRSARKGIFSAGFDLKVFAANNPAASLAMVRAGAELALRLLTFPRPTIGVMEGHAFPMGTFLLLACDLRIGAQGPYRMGLNEVAIGISPPGFAIELARSRLHPSTKSPYYLEIGQTSSKTVTINFARKSYGSRWKDWLVSATTASISKDWAALSMRSSD